MFHSFFFFFFLFNWGLRAFGRTYRHELFKYLVLTADRIAAEISNFGPKDNKYYKYLLEMEGSRRNFKTYKQYYGLFLALRTQGL